MSEHTKFDLRTLFGSEKYWLIDTDRTFIGAKALYEESKEPMFVRRRRRSSSEGCRPRSRDELKAMGVYSEYPKQPDPYETEEETMASLRRLWNRGEGFTFAKDVIYKMWHAQIAPTSRVFAFFIKFLVREPRPSIQMDIVMLFFLRIAHVNIHTWSSLIRALGTMHAWDKVVSTFNFCRSNIQKNSRDFAFRAVLYQAAYETINANTGCPREFSNKVYALIEQDNIKLRTPGDGQNGFQKGDVHNKENSGPNNRRGKRVEPTRKLTRSTTENGVNSRSREDSFIVPTAQGHRKKLPPSSRGFEERVEWPENQRGDLAKGDCSDWQHHSKGWNFAAYHEYQNEFEEDNYKQSPWTKTPMGKERRQYTKITPPKENWNTSTEVKNRVLERHHTAY